MPQANTEELKAYAAKLERKKLLFCVIYQIYFFKKKEPEGWGDTSGSKKLKNDNNMIIYSTYNSDIALITPFFALIVK